jgi:hypothetical protein
MGREDVGPGSVMAIPGGSNVTVKESPGEFWRTRQTRVPEPLSLATRVCESWMAQIAGAGVCAVALRSPKISASAGT